MIGSPRQQHGVALGAIDDGHEHGGGSEPTCGKRSLVEVVVAARHRVGRTGQCRYVLQSAQISDYSLAHRSRHSRRPILPARPVCVRARPALRTHRMGCEISAPDAPTAVHRRWLKSPRRLVEYAGEPYFNLLRTYTELGRYFALGKQVIVSRAPVRSSGTEPGGFFNRLGYIRADVQLLLPEQGIGAEVAQFFRVWRDEFSKETTLYAHKIKNLDCR